MPKQKQSYGPIILRLLLDGVIEPFETRSILWDELLLVTAQNGVLVRVVDQLQQIGLDPPDFFCAAAEEMRAGTQRELALITRIGERCIESNINFIFAKALQNYPDKGRDIDLYVTPRSTSVDAAILRGLNATPLKRNLRNRIDGTATYRVAGCDSLLDIHHGRVGMLGEHKLYISQIIRNGGYLAVEGNEFLITSPEDQLIFQALQKVVQRSYLRLSDLVTPIRLFRGTTLDWNYILNTARDLNIFYGLGCYLNFVEHIHREVFKESLLPEFPPLSLISKKPGTIEFKDGFYRFPRIAVGSRDYADRFGSAVRSANWSVASRLSLLPVLALTTIFRKLRIS